MVEQLANEYKGKVKFYALDAHNNYDTASAFGIMGLPTLVFFKGGQEVGRIVGAVPKDKIAGEIKAKLGA